MAGKRRGTGEGSPQRQPNGRWKAIHTIDWKSRKTMSRTFDKKSEATAWLAQKKAERDAGTQSPVPAQSMLLCDWVSSWLAEVKRDQSTATFQAYQHHTEKFLVPALGRFPIAEIKPMAIRGMLSDLEGEYGGRSTLQEIYKIANTCFAAANEVDLIPNNPVEKVSRPKHERADIHPFTVEEVQAILAAAESHRLRGLFVVAFSLGLRQGELFGLEWSDLDWERGSIRIERQAVSNRGKVELKPPKTKAGRRTLELAKPVIESLRDRQAVAMSEGQAGVPLVFPAPRGGYNQRSTFAAREWKPILRACGINERGLHHARHTFATHALLNGCPLHVVSKILGHANPSITLNIYSHLIDTAQTETVSKVANLFAG